MLVVGINNPDDVEYEYDFLTNGLIISVSSNCLKKWHDLHVTSFNGMAAFIRFVEANIKPVNTVIMEGVN